MSISSNAYSDIVEKMNKSDVVQKHLTKHDKDERFVAQINALFFVLHSSPKVEGDFLETNKEHFYYLYKLDGDGTHVKFSIMVKIRYVFNDIKTIYIEDLYKKPYSPYHIKDD